VIRWASGRYVSRRDRAAEEAATVRPPEEIDVRERP